MHVAILVIAALGAWITRAYCARAIGKCRTEARSWNERWSWAIAAMVGPVLWLAIAVMSVGSMETHGTMFGYGVSALGQWIAVGFVAIAVVLLGLLLRHAGQIQSELSHYPTVAISAPHSRQSVSVRAIESPAWFAGQVGLFKPELTVGRSLLTQLDPHQLAAIVAHESAHAHYHDTRIFFLLGWLRRCTCWLPHTQDIWQELLMLRELRADRWAAQFVEPLILAETLLTVAQSASSHAPSPGTAAVGFHDFTTVDSFEARIEALLAQEMEAKSQAVLNHRDNRFHFTTESWLWAVLACFPLLAVPFHHL